MTNLTSGCNWLAHSALDGCNLAAAARMRCICCSLHADRCAHLSIIVSNAWIHVAGMGGGAVLGCSTCCMRSRKPAGPKPCSMRGSVTAPAGCAPLAMA